MLRESFADLVRGTGVNYLEEFRTLLQLLNGKAYEIFPDREFQGNGLFAGDTCEIRSFCDICNQNFEEFPIELRGTCRTIQNFNSYYKYYPDSIQSPSLDDLLLLAEYSLTFSLALSRVIGKRGLFNEELINKHVIRHLFVLKDRLHHSMIPDGVFIKLVPDDMIVTEVASRLPEGISIKTFMYRHRSMKGDLKEKRSVLKMLGDQLEPQREMICNHDLASAIFSILNNMNIRHNNVYEGDRNYRPYVASLPESELETWYDRLYQMMLAAFAGLDAEHDLEIYKANKNMIGMKTEFKNP